MTEEDLKESIVFFDIVLFVLVLLTAISVVLLAVLCVVDKTYYIEDVLSLIGLSKDIIPSYMKGDKDYLQIINLILFFIILFVFSIITLHIKRQEYYNDYEYKTQVKRPDESRIDQIYRD